MVGILVGVAAELDNLLGTLSTYSQLAALVGAPGVDLAALGHGEHVVLPADDLARLQSHQSDDWLRLWSEDHLALEFHQIGQGIHITLIDCLRSKICKIAVQRAAGGVYLAVIHVELGVVPTLSQIGEVVVADAQLALPSISPRIQQRVRLDRTGHFHALHCVV